MYDGAPAIRSMRNAIARMATAETAMIALERVGRARKVSTKGGMDYTWVWKMSWAASTALVRICEASCMASWARSTAMTTAVGSDAWPVASAWAASAASVWEVASESSDLPSRSPKPTPVDWLPVSAAPGALSIRNSGPVTEKAGSIGDRRHQRRRSRVRVNICLAACMAVTLAS